MPVARALCGPLLFRLTKTQAGLNLPSCQSICTLSPVVQANLAGLSRSVFFQTFTSHEFLLFVLQVQVRCSLCPEILSGFCNIVPNCDQQNTHGQVAALPVAIPEQTCQVCPNCCYTRERTDAQVQQQLLNPSGGVVTKEKTHDRETPWFGVCTDEEVLGTYVTALYMYTVKKSQPFSRPQQECH